MVAFFAGLAWAYFHFIQDRYLEKPGEWLEVTDDYDREQYNNYRQRMKKTTRGEMDMQGKKFKEFLVDTKNGKYKDRWSDFKQRYTERVRELRDLASDINPRSVPKPYAKPHLAYCQALSHWYNSANLLYASQASEIDVEKKDKLKEAIKEFNAGKSKHQAARPMFEEELGK